ncbi:MAG: DUF362 domain-containing protein [Calditrichaeota bacterium]|nr:DUF362 domain-containing protein [Calditrichota bacterium]
MSKHQTTAIHSDSHQTNRASSGQKKAFVAVHSCSSYSLPEVENAIRKVLSEMGGIEAFVRPGDRVLLKPNLLAAHPPEKAVTTHPAVVEAVARLVQEAGGQVWIGDSPSGSIRGIKRFWKVSGFLEVAERVGAELVSFETGALSLKVKNGRRYFLSKWVEDADVVINLPKFKTHNLMLFTGAVKNMYGTLPGLQKGDFHRLAPHPADFAKILLDVYELTRPTLSIMDGIIGMEGNGPAAGQSRKVGLIFASTDAVALDVVASFLMGYSPESLPTVREARERGTGATGWKAIETSVPDLESLRIPDFKLPSNWKIRVIPKPILKALGRVLWTRPAADPKKCIGCSICVENCPVDAMRLVNKIPVIDYKKCINCLCCDEICPENAMIQERSFLARILS